MHRIGRRIAGILVLAAVGCGKEAVTSNPPEAESTPAVADRMRVPFDVATAVPPPQDASYAVEKTLSGKSTAKLIGDVREAWDTVRFEGPDGKLAPTRATISTDSGNFEITFFPDAAPNHVRNFLALAKAGFYDGLVFERIVRQETVATDGTRNRYEFLTAGCPLGEGSTGKGHIGYFLKPEFSDKFAHEEGTVGFWREDDENSAGTRFYIMLGPCAPMDGKYTIIGKVTLGMEIVHAIANAPVREMDYEKPVTPVVIRKVDRQP